MVVEDTGGVRAAALETALPGQQQRQQRKRQLQQWQDGSHSYMTSKQNMPRKTQFWFVDPEPRQVSGFLLEAVLLFV